MDAVSGILASLGTIGAVAALVISAALAVLVTAAFGALGALVGATGALEDKTSEKIDAVFSAQVWSRLGDRIPRFPGRAWIGRMATSRAKAGLTRVIVAKVVTTLQLLAIKGLGRFAILPMLALLAGGSVACGLASLGVSLATDSYAWLGVPALGLLALVGSLWGVKSLLLAAADLAEELAVSGATAVAGGVASGATALAGAFPSGATQGDAPDVETRG